MANLVGLKGEGICTLILGMEQLGCKYIKTDINNMSIYFDIPKDFSKNMLERSDKAFKEILGLTLKVKRLED